jgi:hypothetical protein
MIKKTAIRFYAFALIVLPVLFTFQNCKKSSGSSSSDSSYPFTATVSGKAFSANFVNPSIGGPGFAEVDNTNGLSIMVCVGIQIINSNDTNIFVVVFPTNITLNKPINLDPTLNTGASYAAETSPGSGAYNVYGTNPAYGGSGTLTVTEYDQVNNVVAGTFSGTLGSTAGTTVTVTNGKFRCTITTASNPFPPNVKI